jgi:hypothetical protein
MESIIKGRKWIIVEERREEEGGIREYTCKSIKLRIDNIEYRKLE